VSERRLASDPDAIEYVESNVTDEREAIAHAWPATEYTLRCIADGKVLENRPKSQQSVQG
jgi:hypothetical protein